MKKTVTILICLIVFCYSFGFTQDYEIYVIQPKDTLGIIAAKYKIPMNELAKMNNRDINKLIFVGEGIKVPLLKSLPKITQEDIVQKAVEGVEGKIKAQANRFDVKIKDLQKKPLEKENNRKDTIDIIIIMFVVVVISSFFIYLLIYVYFLKHLTSNLKVLTLSFQGGSVFEIKCRQLINGRYVCPVCEFDSLDEQRMIRHLKGEYKNAKKIGIKKTLKLFKKKEVVA